MTTTPPSAILYPYTTLFRSTSVTPDAGNTLGGTLTMGSVSESATTAAGTVGWTYQVADDATDYLAVGQTATEKDRKSTRLNSCHANISYAAFSFTEKNEAPT